MRFKIRPTILNGGVLHGLSQFAGNDRRLLWFQAVGGGDELLVGLAVLVVFTFVGGDLDDLVLGMPGCKLADRTLVTRADLKAATIGSLIGPIDNCPWPGRSATGKHLGRLDRFIMVEECRCRPSMLMLPLLIHLLLSVKRNIAEAGRH